MKTLALLLLAFCAACSNGQATSQSQSSDRAQARPKLPLAGRVTDAAEILDAAQEATLSTRLEQLERTTGHQMVVVTVPTLGGQDVAAFTRELGNAWGIGRAEENDGVVLLVAPHERKMRIAVGYGLERKLPDALCQQIIARLMLPRFRQADLPGGIDAGVKAVIDRLQ
jgi:uncharacterized protein